MSQEFKNADDQEIDFSIVGRKIKKAASGLDSRFFRFLFFIKRNSVVLSILVVAGAAIGFYLDRSKSYNNEMIVIPNFGSTDHLYSQINLLQSKISEGDTAFIKQLGIKHPTKIVEIEIEPINNVYSFASQNPINFELLKLMAEDGSISKAIEDEVTSKNYQYHKIVYVTKGTTNREETMEPLLNFFSSNIYFDTIKKQQTINMNEKLRLNDSVIKQIDGILSEFKSTSMGSKSSSNLVYINENTQLNDILRRKDELINEQAALRISKINYTKIVKEVTSSINVVNSSGLAGKNKFLLPLIFVFLFLIAASFVRYFKRGVKRNRI